jgi:hypothetical protein
MAVDVAVNLKLAAPGEFSFQHQLALQGQGVERATNQLPMPGRIVPQTSSVIAPGLVRRMPVRGVLR